jgi:predicted RND superfamily exporter protein
MSFGRSVIRARKWIVGMTIVITAVLAFFIKDLEVDPDVFNYLPDDDPKASLFKEVGINYGGNYIGIIGIESDNIFNTSTLSLVRDITDSVRFTDGVGTVTSLTNVIDIKGTDWGIEIGKLIDEYDIPDEEEELLKLKDYTLSDDMYRGTLVSEDATFTAIMFRINEGNDKIAVAGEIRDRIESMDIPEKIYFGGMPFAIESLGEIIMNDLLFLGPLTALVIILLLFMGFRSWRGGILPLLTVAVSIAWTVGLMGLTGVRISIISDVIPVILLAVGSAYTIHVFNRIREEDGSHTLNKTENALNYIRTPVFLTAITTMAGFVSFIFGAYLTMISSFGIFTAAGVLFAMVLSLTFAPSLLSFFPQEKNGQGAKPRKFLESPLAALAGIITTHPKRMLSAWAPVVLIGVAGIFLIERKVDVIDYFKRSDPTYVAEKVFRDKFGGSMPVYVVVKGDIQSPEVLRRMDDISEYMKGSPAIVHTQSLVELIEKMNELMKDGKRIPDSKLKVQQLWFLLEGQDVMEQLVNFEKDEALINATFNTGDVDTMKEFTGEFQEYIDRNKPSKGYNPARVPPDSLSIAFTGLPSLYLKIDKSLINSQLQSLIYALALVFLMVSVILRSIRLGLYTMGPIMITLIMLFGIMGIVSIPLDIATVLVGSVSIGIGIDYAIHMITHFNSERRKGKDVNEAIRLAIGISGRSISINVLSVALGFLVLVFSNLVPLQRFGLLVAITMFTSGAAAITFLPSLLILGEKLRTKRKSS